jgi:hypothetical protein
VISIIIILASLTIPAVSKFLDGQALAQSGRVVQGAFNDARQAAITQRVNNYLLFFRKPDMTKPGEFLYGIRRFSETEGYDGPEHLLLRGTQFDMAASTTGVHAKVAYSLHGELPLPVFEGLPPDTDTDVFTVVAAVPTSTVPTWTVVTGGAGLSGALKWVEFRKDGTIGYDGFTVTETEPMVGTNRLFDMSVEFDGVEESVFDGLRDGASMNLRESGGLTGAKAVDERCFVDVRANTGRVVVRVATAKLP